MSSKSEQELDLSTISETLKELLRALEHINRNIKRTNEILVLQGSSSAEISSALERSNSLLKDIRASQGF